MHHSMKFLPMGSQSAAAGLIQLCAELHRSGLLTDDAMERIKSAIVDELTDRAPRSMTKNAFRSDTHDRLDKVLSGCEHMAHVLADPTSETLLSSPLIAKQQS